MNKSDFIKVVAEVGNYKTEKRINKEEAQRALDAVIGAIEKTLQDNETIELIGFGKFENALQKGKTGKIPGKNEKYTTKDKYVPKFKPGKSLKDSIAAIKVKK